MESRYDVAVVGGGVIGLMTAYELAERGASVAVFDRGPIGKESSWAGAGILSPANLSATDSPFDRLRVESYAAFPRLSENFREETGVDIGFRKTGGVELAGDADEASELERSSRLWAKEGIPFERLGSAELRRREPELRPQPLGGYVIPGLWQVRNPRLIQAVTKACQRRGVQLFPEAAVEGFQREGERASAVLRADGERAIAGDFVVAAGAWSTTILAGAGFDIPVRPIRGQILALQTNRPIVRHIVEIGKNYLVPRDDGVVLVGSTEEDVGFEKLTTPEAIADLGAFALGLFPALESATTIATWAGLRPGCALGSPIIGRAPGWENLWVATGHFRQGLQLSPGTARLLADWLTGRPTFATPTDFAVDADRSAFRPAFFS